MLTIFPDFSQIVNKKRFLFVPIKDEKRNPTQ